ncbi:oxidoreductase, partial [Klebsiella aerogenes]
MQPIDPPTAFSMDFFSLKGKTAIVTGGNSGLGQAFAV